MTHLPVKWELARGRYEAEAPISTATGPATLGPGEQECSHGQEQSAPRALPLPLVRGLGSENRNFLFLIYLWLT